MDLVVILRYSVGVISYEVLLTATHTSLETSFYKLATVLD